MQAIFIVMPVFLLIGLGCFLQYKKWLSPQTLKENSSLLYWLIIPCTLIRGILSADVSVVQSASFLIAVWSPYLVTLTLVWVTARRNETRGRFATLMLFATRGNNFYAGIPIISLAMGQRGVEAGTLILAFSLVVMQMFSIGGSQLALFGAISWDTIKKTCLQLLKNPLFMTSLISLLLVSSGLNRLPMWLNETLAILSDVSTGLALIVLGAGIHLRNIFKNVISVWKIVLFKLVIHPIVTYFIFTSFGLPHDIINAGVLLASMPVAANSSIIAQEMGMEESAHCAMGTAVTTFLALFTLPVLIRLLNLA